MTNGYDISKVKTALQSRLGWINPTQDGYDIVDSENQESESGRYFNDDSFHTSLTVQNIVDCQPDDELNDESKNCYLRQLRDANIISMLSQVFTKTEVIDRGLIFRKYGNVALDTVSNGGKFVGLRFRLAEGDYGLKLVNATFFFNGAATFKLYLFHEFAGKVKEWNVATVANKQVVLPLGEAIRNNGEAVKDGEYFLGYFQADLGSVQAINYNPARRDDFIVFNAQPIETGVSDNAPDYQNYSYSSNCYGLNVEISSFRDLTQTIVSNAEHFDNLQGLMMAAKVIDLVCNSNRTNITQRISRENMTALLTQLNGIRTETAYIPGLKSLIEKEVKKVKEIIFPKPEPMSVNIACS